MKRTHENVVWLLRFYLVKTGYQSQNQSQSGNTS